MSLELFIEKLDELLGSGILKKEIDAGLLLRIEISLDGVRFEGIRSEEFCPTEVVNGTKNTHSV